ncbi:MAG: NAD(P)-dependent alcohol dehydrogenase, partial [Nitrospinota bacterium]|nr:NAD(P)-dependent alcohol dehydrogenase [Nitrospinota bacterium]
MKAVVIDEYGPPEVLRLADVEKPVPKRNEILVRVRAVAVTFGECKARNFKIPYSQFWLPGPLWLPARLMLGFSKPRHAIPGSEMSGDVEAVGEDVTSFKPGGQIFGFIEGFGADAEYVCFPEDAVVAAKPSNMTYEEAAPVTHGALTALCFIRKAGIKEGERVLVFGASGGIGRCAVQLAKNQGAHVTGVCSGPKMDVVKRL